MIWFFILGLIAIACIIVLFLIANERIGRDIDTRLDDLEQQLHDDGGNE